MKHFFSSMFIVLFMVTYVMGSLSLVTFLVQSYVAKVLILVGFHWLLCMAMASLILASYTPCPSIPHKYFIPESVLLPIKQLKVDHCWTARRNELLERYLQDTGLVVYDRMIFTPQTTPGGGDGQERLLALNYCNLCTCIKPDRAHHCHSCGQCVGRMDHHCVLIGGCVHAANHKCFVLFLLYTWLTCALMAVGFIPLHMIGIWHGIPDTFDPIMGSAAVLFTVTEIVSLLYWLTSVTPMLVIHMGLILQNATTIDKINKYTAYRPMHIVGYDTGRAYDNFKLMMGSWFECWNPWSVPLMVNQAWVHDSQYALITTNKQKPIDY